MKRLALGNSFVAACLMAAAVTVGSTAQAQTPRPADDVVADRILYKLETDPIVRKYDIKVKVDAPGVVTLSGDVATAAQKAQAEKVARIDGVSKVNNTIVVDPDEDKTLADRTKSGLNKAGNKINDAWITTKVKWFFIGEDALKDSDINVDTKNNVVTLKGTVKTEAGRKHAIALANATEGVSRVVDQLVIK
jgi:hyperosmotically inducible periplasmic protein